MIAIKKLLLIVIIGKTFIARAFLHILADPPYTATYCLCPYKDEVFSKAIFLLARDQ